MTIQLFGIPTCESCRKARKWLQEHGMDHVWVDLRTSPPSPETISSWVAALGSKPLRNTSGRAYRELGEDKKTWDDHRWVEEFSMEPMLLKRPILVIDGKANHTGFKPDLWSALLPS